MVHKKRVLQRMGFHWLMQCAIADRKLMRILSSVVIRVVLFRNSICLVWVSTLFPRPGIAPDVELYQNLRKEALNNTLTTHFGKFQTKTHTCLNTHQANSHTNLNKHRAKPHTCHHKHQSNSHTCHITL